MESPSWPSQFFGLDQKAQNWFGPIELEIRQSIT